MQQIKFTLQGIVPLIMHSDTMCNPLNPLTKQIKSITSKRKKSDEDIAEIARLEWRGGLYYDKTLGTPYIPGQNIDGMLVEAAKLNKRGKEVKRAVITVENIIPLQYNGSKDPEKMFGDGATEFVDMRAVVIQRARTIRCRPIFQQWGLSFSVAFNPEIFNREDVITLMCTSGELIGLCEMRPRYGKFQVAKAE